MRSTKEALMANTTPRSARRAAALLAIALVTGAALSGCGSSAPATATTTAQASTKHPSTSTASATTRHRRSNPHPYGYGRVAFARCMRLHGVSSFSDSGVGNNVVHLNPSAPGFRSAATACSKLVPGVLPATPGSTTHPTPQTLDKLVRIAKCMRAHGVPQFPDPRASVPANPAQDGIQEVTDFDGAILLFPSSINLQAPAYRQALTACGAPPLGLPH
jgi:hypothetical protein